MKLNQAFWDCDCARDYIHPKTQAMCPYCGAWAKDQPDSIAEKVEEMLKVLALRWR